MPGQIAGYLVLENILKIKKASVRVKSLNGEDLFSIKKCHRKREKNGLFPSEIIE